MKRIPKQTLAQNLAEMAWFGYNNRIRFCNTLKRMKYDTVVALYLMARYSEFGMCDMATIIGCLLCNILVSGDKLKGAEFIFRSNGENTCVYQNQTIKLPL